MTAAHTPGPWGATDPWIDDNGRSPYMAEVSSPASVYAIARVIDTPNGEANARLIAAAPELLAALQRVDWAAQDLGIAGPGEVSGADAVDALAALLPGIRAALAKATAPATFAVLTAGEDCWTIQHRGDPPEPIRYASRAEAQAAIDEHMDDLTSEGIDFDPDEFSVVRVEP